ncbi:penicillin-binding protein 1C [Noviherbaspirillum sp. DKR-6]|uniref:peptidoglycan glycosyltransferase n=1 Tax=Noviherbaspirillum pedocola TaxID=2801341 RepID=A0A934W5P8_9BURK|nr:penicillin-binding protein 1C [Noviherbaspirillum pedocola]
MAISRRASPPGRRFVTALALALCCAASTARELPSYAEARASYRSSDALLLDRHGAPLHALRVDATVRRLPWVRLQDVSPALRNALVASEDRRFYEHSGVDWNAAAAAAWGNLWHSRTRGASTITMQLAGLLQEDLKRGKGARSLKQKLSQALAARELEREWRKDEILEAYLNLVSFRGELVGVHALARVMFGKHPDGLDKVESALAAALVRAPNAGAGEVARRACGILREQGAPDACLGLEGVTQLRLARLTDRSARRPEAAAIASSVAPQLAPHLARRLLKRPGERVVSTLDASLQRQARDALTRQLAALTGRNIEDGAVLVLDNASGDVLAWVGSSSGLSDAPEVDGVLARRQAGSTLKPFMYGLALERRWLTAASLLDDSPVNLATAGGLYMPRNYDGGYKGLVSLRTALASSLNIPAVRTLVTVTPEAMFERLQTLGFALPESGDYYGYSLALGSADVTLLALTNAFRTLANGGRLAATRTRLDQAAPASTQVMDAAAAWIVSDILSDRQARARTFGLDSPLALRTWSAVKTGTSKDMRDNWCIGYSARYTVGVWVGNASGAPMWNVSGVTGAAPVWQEIMQLLHAGAPAAPPAMPAGVRAQRIRFDGGIEAARTEYFLDGTERDLILAAQPEAIRPAIRYPARGMLVALDPDIPPARQRLHFQATGVARPRWLLDGKPLPAAAQHDGWLPWPGRHALALVDEAGRELDALRFEVRGAVGKVAKGR